MKQISEKQLVERNGLVAALTQEAEAIKLAIGEANEKIAALNEKIAVYNNTLKNARDFRDDLTQKMQDYYDERTEAWQEGEAGAQYGDWMESWGSIELGNVLTVEPPDSIELDHADELEALPDSPE